MNEWRQLARRLAFLLIYEGDMGQRGIDERLAVLQDAGALADLTEVSGFYEETPADQLALWQNAIAVNLSQASPNAFTSADDETAAAKAVASHDEMILREDAPDQSGCAQGADAAHKGTLDEKVSPAHNKEMKAVLEALAFIDQAVRGVAAHQSAIDEVVSEHARHWRITRMHSADRSILRLGTWELLFSPDAKDAALVINEAVELAKIYGEDDSYKFVNAILDAAYKKERPL